MPVTFFIAKQLDINPLPFLITEIFASNIGGTATLIGDPPNIIIGSAAGLSFMDFLKELTGVVSIILLVVVFLMMFINDLICFLGAKLFGYLTMSFVKWFIHVEALTLIFNGAWIFVLLYIITVFNRYATIKNIRFKRMEKLHMQNIRRK